MWKRILDSVREKLIYITPEETVRQKILSYLVDELGVPKGMIAVEEHLSHYGIESNKRADIVIHKYEEDRGEVPIAIVECKAPGVPLGEKARNQLCDYCDELGVDYAMMVNDTDKMCFKYIHSEEKYVILEDFPKYSDMLEGMHTELDIGELPERIPFDKLQSYLKSEFANESNDYYFRDISSQTEMPKAVAAFNLFEGFLDIRHKIRVGDYGLFKLIEDYGVRMLSYGNAAGGTFFGPYRSFLIDVNGSTEFVSFNMSTYCLNSKNSKVKTCLSVAIDNEKDTHHALQLVIDDNLQISGEKCKFYHHGRIAVGKMGSGKINELRMFVEERYPQIINGNKFYLGELINDRLWRLDDPEVIKLVVNLISYALIRDEYRAFVKKNK